MGSGVKLPYLLSVACGDMTSVQAFASPDLRYDHKASFTGLMFQC